MMEIDHLNTLSFGTSKIVKNMSDYEEAIEKLKAQANDEASAEAKTES
jgi:predicted ATP-grasp superfamily ATP-dependent carboligase